MADAKPEPLSEAKPMLSREESDESPLFCIRCGEPYEYDQCGAPEYEDRLCLDCAFLEIDALRARLREAEAQLEAATIRADLDVRVLELQAQRDAADRRAEAMREALERIVAAEESLESARGRDAISDAAETVIDALRVARAALAGRGGG